MRREQWTESLPPDDRMLMGVRLDTDFTYDAKGRMLHSNEPREDARHAAPRLVLGRTVDGPVVRFGAQVSDSVVRQLAVIVARQVPTGEHPLPSAVVSAVRKVLLAHGPITNECTGLAFRFPNVIARPAGVVQLTGANRNLVRRTFPWLYEDLEDWAPCWVVVEGGAAVSVCFTSRLGTNAAEAGVETLPAFRHCGYAAATSAAWGTTVREQSHIPLYSTALENVASQAVARRLGLVQFGVDTTWT